MAIIEDGGIANKDFRWWDKSDPAQSVFDAFAHIKDNDSPRLSANETHMRLYGNLDIQGLEPFQTYKWNTNQRLTLNVIKSAADTVTARIAKSKPRPVFQTFGGNWSLRRRAKLLDKWVDGQFYASKVHEVAPKVFLDAAVFGTGAMKIFRRGQQIKVERVFPGELFVDQLEGFYQEPTQLFQRKYIHRDVLMELYGDDKKKAGAIRMAKVADPEEENIVGKPDKETISDQIEVVEAWHLPSGPNAGDGRHVISIEDTVLEEEEWTKDYFPFVFLRWSERLRGFWGMGLAEELVGLQVEINKLLMKIQKIIHLVSVPRIFMEMGNRTPKAHINNQIGAIVPFKGQRPVVDASNGVPQEIFAHLDRLYQRAFETSGISMDTATANLPSGIRSAVGQREFHDIQTERFSIIARNYEQMHLDIALQMVDLGKEIAQENPDYSVVAQKDKHTIQEVKWEDVDMDKDQYVVKVFPSSSLPTTPAGRLSFVQELLGAGLIDFDTGKRLLDFPDLEREMALDRAASDNLDRIIEKMVDEGEWEPAEPFMDPDLALKKFQAAYNKGKEDGVPDERLRLLRDFMAMTNEMKLKAERQLLAQQQAQQMGAQPRAQPGSPPPVAPDGQQAGAIQPQDGTIAQ